MRSATSCCSRGASRAPRARSSWSGSRPSPSRSRVPPASPTRGRYEHPKKSSIFRGPRLMPETKTRKKSTVVPKQLDHLHAPYFDSAGERQGEYELPKLIFDETPNLAVMHQA